MENNKISSSQSKRPKIYYKKRYNIALKKYIITTYNENAFTSYKKNISQNNTIKNSNTISECYYKNPFFYNNNNLNLQLKILKKLSNIKISRNSTPIPSQTNQNTNHSSSKSLKNKYKSKVLSHNNRTYYKDKSYNLDLPSIHNNRDRDNNDIKIEINDNNDKKLIIKNFSSIDNFSSKEIVNKNHNSFLETPKNYKKNGEYFYKIIFKSKPLYKSDHKIIIDNKFNMIYAENEAQYRKIIEKEYNRLLSKGKKAKSKNVAPSIKLKLNDAKSRIQFMKGVMDYSYPGFVLSKIKLMQKKLSEHKNNINYIDRIKGIEKRNKEKLERNEFRKEYLLKSITLFK